MSHPLAPYPAPEARDAELAALAARAGGERIRYGQSVEGRDLLAVRLPQRGAGGAAGAAGAQPPRARLLSAAGIHGVEYVATRVAMAVLAAAAADAAPLAALRERAEIWVIPCLNPDGYARTWEAGGAGTLGALRPNARGVDLNRNFPLPPGAVRRALPGAGSARPGARTYRGPHPLSEPETAALAALLGEHPVHASTSGHSFMGRLIPARTPERETFRAYGELCRAFAAGQPHARYGRLASRVFDTFTGELEDFQHHVCGTWAICVETFPVLASLRQHLRAPSLFWRFNPHHPEPWVKNDLPGIAAFFEAALARGPVPRR